MRAPSHVRRVQPYRSGLFAQSASQNQLRQAKFRNLQPGIPARFLAVRSASRPGSAEPDANGGGGEREGGEEQQAVFEYDSDDYEEFQIENGEMDQSRRRGEAATALPSTSSRSHTHPGVARVTAPVSRAYRGAQAMLRPSITRTSATIQRVRDRARQIHEELPEGTWGKLLWVWDRPGIQKIRLTFSMVNLSFRLPALVALIVTQGATMFRRGW